MMNKELTEEEAEIEIQRLEKDVVLCKAAQVRTGARVDDWRSINSDQYRKERALEAEIRRVKVGNTWKHVLESREYDHLQRCVIEHNKYREDVLQDRNLLKTDVFNLLSQIHDIKLSALRFERELKMKIKYNGEL